MKERHLLPKRRLLSLLCSHQAVRSHLVSQETSTLSNTITLLILLNSHFHLQAHRCFVTIKLLEFSLWCIKNVMHFARKGLKYLGLRQTSQLLLWLYRFIAQSIWFSPCHTAVMTIPQSWWVWWHSSTDVAHSSLPTQDEAEGNHCHVPALPDWGDGKENTLERKAPSFFQEPGDSLFPYIWLGIWWQGKA